ncbi:MAG: alpha/beta fold hydrolase [Actinomycetota bacterium]|nr:alpha/beta fold hydrolase [Actinomycetota bacterium]
MTASRSTGHTRRGAGKHVEVAVSGELNAPVGTGIELCYQTCGDSGAEPLLLVMGLGGPMNWWDPVLCESLARAGFLVVRYDNRDTGRSSQGHGRVTRGQLVRAFGGASTRAPYSLHDLAEDAFGLLDHLGIVRTNVVGVSMGGMIAQTMAIDHPARVASLVSIMSTTGRRTVGWQDPRLLPRLLGRRPRTREEYIDSSAKTWAIIGSPGFPQDWEKTRSRAGETYDRGVSGSGLLRQMMAVLTQPDRTRQLRGLSVPAAVVHGTSDKMVHLSGGRATAGAIPGAELLLVDGMGHDLPPELFDTFTEVVRRTADRAKQTG